MTSARWFKEHGVDLDAARLDASELASDAADLAMAEAEAYEAAGDLDAADAASARARAHLRRAADLIGATITEPAFLAAEARGRA